MSEPLGQALRAARRAIGDIPMAEFAQRMEISERALSNYELGKRLPDIDFLVRFSLATDADLGELLQLRIQAAGFEGHATLLRERRAEYMAGAGSGQRESAAAHARRVLLAEKDLDPAWSLALMELASKGEITPDGIDQLMDFVREWTLSDDRVWEWIEEHADEVKRFFDEDGEGQMAELRMEDK